VHSLIRVHPCPSVVPMLQLLAEELGQWNPGCVLSRTAIACGEPVESASQLRHEASYSTYIRSELKDSMRCMSARAAHRPVLDRPVIGSQKRGL